MGMKNVCMECRQHYGEDIDIEAVDGLTTSHGVCPSCEGTWLQRLELQLAESSCRNTLRGAEPPDLSGAPPAGMEHERDLHARLRATREKLGATREELSNLRDTCHRVLGAIESVAEHADDEGARWAATMLRVELSRGKS